MKPTLFIASSSEQKEVMAEIQRQLSADASILQWTEAFELTQPFLTSLLRQLGTADFALFIFAPDDVSKIRDREFLTVRDNVVFELGLFLGRLGAERCAIIAPRQGAGDSLELHLPSDLAGIKTADYDPALPLADSLKGACAQVRALLSKSQQLAAQICGRWIEIKEIAEHPFALVDFQREGNVVKVSGTSYYADGTRHVQWPDKVDFSSVNRMGVLHCYDARFWKDGTVGDAHGITSYTFHSNAAGPPDSGYGHYIAHSDGSGLGSGRVNFKLKRLTEEYRRFLLGGALKLPAEKQESALIVALARVHRTRKIVITGGPCSGKTTLMAQFRQQPGTVIIEEAATRIMQRTIEKLGDAHLFAKWRADNFASFQAQVFVEQQRLEREIPEHCTLAFFDRGGIDGIAYLRYHGLEPTHEMYTYAREMVFSRVFLLETPGADIFDARPHTGRNSTRAESEEMGELLADVYAEFGHRPMRVPASMSFEERAQFIREQSGL